MRIYNSPEKIEKLGFRNNVAMEKGTIGSDGGSTLIIENTMIRDNYSKGMASGVYTSNSNLTIRNTTFMNNTVDGVGALTMESDSTFTCTQCKFIGN